MTLMHNKCMDIPPCLPMRNDAKTHGRTVPGLNVHTIPLRLVELAVVLDSKSVAIPS